LPPVIEQIFYSEMTPEQYEAYERTRSAIRNEILQLFDQPLYRAKVFNELMRLRQMANHPALLEADTSLRSGKFEDVLAQWENVRRSGHKVLFFSSFEKHLRLFRAHFEAQGYPFAWLTGSTEERQRALEIARFQSDASVQAFFMTLKAGGVGLNLTSADYIFLLDPWWNPAVEHQAIARAHRIGQSRPVTVLRFIARRSIEEKILVLQEQKRQLGQAFFDAPAPEVELSRDDIEILLE
jgi:non-specific serine/threonine protein kinase